MEKSYTFKRPQCFDLNLIFDCGQAFRFTECDKNSFSGVAFERGVTFCQNEDTVTVIGADEADFNNIWKHYLALDTDYPSLRRAISSLRPNDKVLTEAMECGKGIRLLNQDKWETLLSFIISQNNNIPRIRSIIERLSLELGEASEHNGATVYAFPTPEAILSVGVEGLREMKVGFRAPYMIDAAERVADGRLSLEGLDTYNTEELLKELMTVKGVGLKVASCVALFGYGRLDSFPIDVWIKRVLDKYYPDGFDHTALPNTAGLVQQYLFYYERFRQ